MGFGQSVAISPGAYPAAPHVRLVLASRPDHTGKRLTDLVLSVGLLVLAAPVLLVLATLVWLTSRGRVLYRQTRVGRHGELFTMLKFRTMYAGSHAARATLKALDDGNGVLFKIRRDPRVTPVGRVLRRLSLDELPQLLNVLTGHMSLVGPRPALPEETVAYTDVELGRLSVKPGLTGLWQVSGRSDLSWEQSIHLDLHYVRQASLRMDFRILLRTLSAVVGGRGAY